MKMSKSLLLTGTRSFLVPIGGDDQQHNIRTIATRDRHAVAAQSNQAQHHYSVACRGADIKHNDGEQNNDR